MQELWKFVSERHGVFTRAEAQRCGVSEEQLRRMIRNREIVRMCRGTYRLASHCDEWPARARAAAVSMSGVLSHRTAAAVWNLDGFRRGRIELTIPYEKPRCLELATIHRSRQFDLVDERMVNGLPVTGPARTILDLFAVLRPAQAQLTVDAALRERLVGWPDLYEVLARHSAKGRDGCGRLRSFLEVNGEGSAIPDSRWNRMVGTLLLDAGLPEPTYEFEVLKDDAFIARVDLAYPRRMLAIELDSTRWHMNQTSFVEDPRRKNRLLLAGWNVLTFTWTDFNDRPRDLVRTVRSGLL